MKLTIFFVICFLAVIAIQASPKGKGENGGEGKGKGKGEGRGDGNGGGRGSGQGGGRGNGNGGENGNHGRKDGDAEEQGNMKPHAQEVGEGEVLIEPLGGRQGGSSGSSSGGSGSSSSGGKGSRVAKPPRS